MYKKLARVGPISFGIFYAVMTLLVLIIMVVIAAVILPLLPNADGIPIDAFAPMIEMVKQGEGIAQLAISLGVMLLISFIAGMIFAILYNLVAMVTGGIKIKTRDLGYDDI